MSLHQELERQQAATACYLDPDKRIPMHVFRGGERCVCNHLTRAEYDRIGARAWNDGVMFRDLEAALPVNTGIYRPPAGDFIVRGVRPDTEAGPDHMAWLSPEASPERLASCRAGILITTEALVAHADGERCCLITEHPRWLFAELVAQFFEPSFMLPWPPQGARGVSSDAELGANVRLAQGVVIGADVQLGNHVTVGPNTVIAHATIGDGVTIGANCSIGLPGFGYVESPTRQWRRVPHLGRVVIEAGVEIGSNTCIDRGVLGDTVIRFGAKIDNLVHIAHNCEIGEFALVIANAMLAGSTKVGVRAWVAPSASTRDHITIGDAAVLGVGAVAVKDVEAGRTVVGNPAKPIPRKP